MSDLFAEALNGRKQNLDSRQKYHLHMLTGRPTKYGAGITLAGDYADLAEAHETVHYLASDTGPLPAHHDEFALALAYDFRKAYEGARRIEPAEVQGSSAKYFAVDILWPVFLVQLGMLRAAAGYLPTSRAQQSTLYRLEACAEQAMSAFDPSVSAICMRWLAHFTPLPETFLFEFVSQQAHSFVFGAAGGKSRFKRLPVILDDINSLSSRYRDFERSLSAQAAKEGCSPQSLVSLEPWAAFKW